MDLDKLDFRITQVDLEEDINNQFKEIAEKVGDIISSLEQTNIKKTNNQSLIDKIKNRSDQLASKGDQVINSTRLYVLREIRKLVHCIFS